MDEYKTVLIGDCGVGKTSIIERIINNSFTNTIQSTIGISDKLYQMDCNGSTVQLRFIDIPGQLGFENIMNIYFKGCIFALAVFDLTNSESLKNIEKWIIKFRENAIGNKCDMKDQISEETIKKEIEDLGIDYETRYISVSAKNNTNFSYLLCFLSSLIEDSKEYEKAKVETNEIDITQEQINTNRCCKS